MEVELMVQLTIPDTTELTAFHTLEKMGYIKLVKLRREDYYKFDVDNRYFENFSKEIGKVDILVNVNKHKFTTKLSDKPFLEKCDENFSVVKILVLNSDDKDGGMLEILKDRLGYTSIKSFEKGVLWTLFISGEKEDEIVQTAKDITENLLFNKHYEEYKIMESVPCQE